MSKEYIDKCLNEAVREIQTISDTEKSYLAIRFLQIERTVSAMGGWANFKHWITNHAKNYWDTNQKLEKELKQLKKDALSVADHYAHSMDKGGTARRFIAKYKGNQ